MSPPAGVLTTSFADTTAANGTTYYYAVRAVDRRRESANSLVVQATPAGAHRARPATPSSLENCFPATRTGRVLNPGRRGSTAASRASRPRTSINKGESRRPQGQRRPRPTFRRRDLPQRLLRRRRRAPDLDASAASPARTQPACDDRRHHRPRRLLELVDVARRSRRPRRGRPASTCCASCATTTAPTTTILLVVRDDARALATSSTASRSRPTRPTTTTAASRSTTSTRPARHRRGHAARGQGLLRPAVRAAADPAQRDWYTRDRLSASSTGSSSRATTSPTSSDTDLERTPALRATTSAYISPRARRVLVGGDARPRSSRRATPASTSSSRGSNEVYWKIRFENGPTARQDRVRSVTRATQSGGADPSGIPTAHVARPGRAPTSPRTRSLGAMYVGDNDNDVLPARRHRRAGHRPRLALHAASTRRRRARRRRSAPRSSAGSGTRASPTASSPPACKTLAQLAGHRQPDPGQRRSSRRRDQ